jgi:hypothetical protein
MWTVIYYSEHSARAYGPFASHKEAFEFASSRPWPWDERTMIVEIVKP